VNGKVIEIYDIVLFSLLENMRWWTFLQ